MNTFYDLISYNYVIYILFYYITENHFRESKNSHLNRNMVEVDNV